MLILAKFNNIYPDKHIYRLKEINIISYYDMSFDNACTNFNQVLVWIKKHYTRDLHLDYTDFTQQLYSNGFCSLNNIQSINNIIFINADHSNFRHLKREFSIAELLK